MEKQRTLKNRVSVKGAGLHTRQCGTLTFNPAPVNSGIRFRRIDLENQPIIEADVDNVIDTARGTTLGKGGVKIYTVEHVLASLRGMGIDNVLIDIDVEETPIMDGSAKFFVDAIHQAGIVEQNAPRNYLVIEEPISYKNEVLGIELTIEPCDHFEIDVKVKYNTRVLDEQHAKLTDLKDFENEIAHQRWRLDQRHCVRQPQCFRRGTRPHCGLLQEAESDGERVRYLEQRGALFRE